MNTIPWLNRCGRNGWMTLALIAVLLAGVILAGCDGDTKVDEQGKCDEQLNEGNWDKAIEICGAIDTDEGHSKTAQAYMGRAGLGLLGFIEKISDTTLEGLALILSVFTLTAAEFSDADKAITELLLINAPSDTDYFNLTLTSDIILASLLKSGLGITVDATTGDITIPGITDTDLASLSSTSSVGEIQTVLDDIYAGTYYQTTPLIYDDADADVLDLLKVSTYVQANQKGTKGFPLESLSSLDFASQIDNGTCGLATGDTASGAGTAAEGTAVAVNFVRRLNTSQTDAIYLAEDLLFVLLDSSGSVDSTLEWGGSFALPSALLNPDHFLVECGGDGTAALDEFTVCMTAGATDLGGSVTSLLFPASLSVDPTLTTTADGTGTICGGANCSFWPLFSIDGDPSTNDATTGTNADDAKIALAQVFHTAYPVDNSITDSTDAAYDASLLCAAGDGWVHAREYDIYLRTFGGN